MLFASSPINLLLMFFFKKKTELGRRSARTLLGSKAATETATVASCRAPLNASLGIALNSGLDLAETCIPRPVKAVGIAF